MQKQSKVRRQSYILRIYNKGKQTVPIQVKPPKGDFYLHEQQVYLRPGKNVTLPKDHLRMEQIQNLAARGVLQILHDSEAYEESQNG